LYGKFINIKYSPCYKSKCNTNKCLLHIRK